MFFDTPHRKLAQDLHLTIKDEKMSSSDDAKNLGVLMDETKAEEVATRATAQPFTWHYVFACEYFDETVHITSLWYN